MKFMTIALMVFCLRFGERGYGNEAVDWFAGADYEGEPLLKQEVDPTTFFGVSDPFTVDEFGCVNGVCRVPGLGFVVRSSSQAEPLVPPNGGFHGGAMERGVVRMSNCTCENCQCSAATIRNFQTVQSAPMMTYSYSYTERRRWRPIQRWAERVRARRSMGLGFFQWGWRR